jgi:N-acetylmuramoyl-L-alanine amidase
MRAAAAKLLFSLALLFLVAGNLSASFIVSAGRRYISDDEFAARYRMTSRNLGSRVELSDGVRKATLYPDKRYAIVNNIRCSLSFAPIRRGKLYISQLDMLSLFDALLGRRSVPWHKVGVIVLDPGHGGKDQGGAGLLYKEKDLTLQLAKKVSLLLQRAGYKVLLTRQGDSFLDLSARAAFANRNKADLFISIHSNATSNRTVSGIETFVMTPSGAPSDSSTQAVNTRYPGNAANNNSVALSGHIHRQLLAKTKAVDRGLKRARFQVLREVNCPAVLLEIGFLSNREEERKLGSDAYQNEIARGIAAGIMAYHRDLINASQKR